MDIEDKEFAEKSFMLQYAPWLDMEEFRAVFSEDLLESIESGALSRANTEYKKDVREFCEGKLKFVPRSTLTISCLRETLRKLCPDSRRDARFGDALGHIARYIQTPYTWTSEHRGFNVKLED